MEVDVNTKVDNEVIILAAVSLAVVGALIVLLVKLAK
jgi:hypothetical protein